MSMTILTNLPTSIKPSRFAEMLAEFGYDGKVHLFDMVIQEQDGRTWTSINYTAAGIYRELNWPETDVLCVTMRDDDETVKSGSYKDRK